MNKTVVLATLVLAGCLAGCGQREIRNHGELDPGLDHVDWEDTLLYVERATMAYKSDETIRKRYPGCLISTVVDERVKAFIDVDESAGRQWLTIRGTDNRANDLEDIEYDKDPAPLLGVRLHEGFRRTSLAVRDWAIPHLDRSRPVRLSGHSLGGAIAVILEAHLISEGYQVEGCVTMGQPKVTNEAGARVFDAHPLLRLVNEKDPVPMLPPVTVVSSAHGIYRHFGPEAILLEKPAYLFLHRHDAERFSVTSAWQNLGHLNAKEHHSQLYLQRVRRLAAEQQRRRALRAR